MAHRKLFPKGESPATDRAAPVIADLVEAIRKGLEKVNCDARAHVVRALDQYLAEEIVRLSPEDLTVRRIEREGQAEYPRLGAPETGEQKE